MHSLELLHIEVKGIQYYWFHSIYASMSASSLLHTSNHV